MMMNQNNKRQQFLNPLILVLILGLTLISGCFDSEDIDRRMIVSPIGIDSNPDGKLLVTFRMPIVLPMGKEHQEENKKGYITRSTLTQGVFPALIDIQNRDEHGIFIGQCRALVFGEAMAKKGLKPVLDFFDRMPTFPPSAFVVIARPTAEDLLKIDWPEQEMHDQNIRWFFSNQANQIFGIKKWTLFRNIYDPLQDPVVPIVTPSDENSTMKLLGLAVFQDDRLVGELDSAESTLLKMLSNLKKENRLIIPLAGSIPTTFNVATGKKKLKVSYHDHPLFKLDLKLNAFIGELGGYQTPLKERDLHQMEAKSANYLQNKYLALFGKLQVLQSDPLDLGNNFRIQQPKHFSLSSWPEEYRRAEFQITVKVFIERLGVLK
jgi:Ger(x)C family germination protein